MNGQERRALRKKAKGTPTQDLETRVNNHRFTKIAEKLGKLGVVVGYSAMILVIIRIVEVFR
jgi:hypothetical protein